MQCYSEHGMVSSAAEITVNEGWYVPVLLLSTLIIHNNIDNTVNEGWHVPVREH